MSKSEPTAVFLFYVDCTVILPVSEGVTKSERLINHGLCRASDKKTATIDRLSNLLDTYDDIVGLVSCTTDFQEICAEQFEEMAYDARSRENITGERDT